MSVVDVHAYTPKRRYHVVEWIAVWQLMCVFAVIGLIWWKAIVGNQAGNGVSPMESAAYQSIAVLLVGLAAVLPIYIYQRRYAHKLVTICSYCRRVQVDDEEWMAIEAYFAEKTQATYSHGVCPVCQERVMTAYRTSHGETSAGEVAAATPAI